LKLKPAIQALFISTRWYLLMVGCAVFFLVSFFLPVLFIAASVFLVLSLLLTAIDGYLLYGVKGGVKANRLMAQRFSLGDENTVTISIGNLYRFFTTVSVVEQLPVQFQKRSTKWRIAIPFYGKKSFTYSLRPLERGVYEFGALLCYVQSPLGLLQRRFETGAEMSVKVYPSFLQLRKYQLLATSDNLMQGVKKIRRLGHSMEFEKIKSYVIGDDIRTLNWKATARSGSLMVNTFTDTREQQVYAIIDKGRSMKMPFEGMTLLDHSINATLSLLNVVLLKHDKAGLISFSNQMGQMVPADKKRGQLQHIVEALYSQQTDFKESDYETLAATLHKRINQRSFLLLFTNFETLSALQRQLPFLISLASRHLICVVFFQNTLLRQLHETQPDTTEGIYIKTIADRFDFEKKQIIKELRRYGIVALLTTPAQLNIDVINKYMELKSRQLL